jgi:hypothetical protein
MKEHEVKHKIRNVVLNFDILNASILFHFHLCNDLIWGTNIKYLVEKRKYIFVIVIIIINNFISIAVMYFTTWYSIWLQATVTATIYKGVGDICMMHRQIRTAYKKLYFELGGRLKALAIRIYHVAKCHKWSKLTRIPCYDLSFD